MLWFSMIILSLYPINIFSEEFVKKGKLVNVITRNIFAIIQMSLIVFLIQFMPISDVYSVYFIYPGIMTVLSYFFLKSEKIGIFDYICLLACFTGVIIIIKPDFIFKSGGESQHNKNFYLLNILAAVFKAIEDIIVRKTGNGAHYLIYPVLYSVLGMALFPIPMVLFDKNYPKFNFMEVVVIFILAVCTYLYHVFLALALQNEDAVRVSIVNYLQIALMYLSDLALFGKGFTFLDFFATLLIFGFNFMNGLLKTLERMNNLNEFKKKIKTEI